MKLLLTCIGKGVQTQVLSRPGLPGWARGHWRWKMDYLGASSGSHSRATESLDEPS